MIPAPDPSAQQSMTSIRCKLLILMLLIVQAGYTQVENVQLSHTVYEFLKQMSVKKILPSIHDDDPNLSRLEVVEYLIAIREQVDRLSNVEQKLLSKFEIEFVPERADPQNTYVIFSKQKATNLLSNKVKYFYKKAADNNTIAVEGIGSVTYIRGFEPEKDTGGSIDGGLRIRGSLFDHLGYSAAAIKGSVLGSGELAVKAQPLIATSFKFIEGLDAPSYDFTEGYLKYYAAPAPGMKLSVQLGREQLQYGFGYSNRMTLSGNTPNLDFIKLSFRYGIIHFSSITGSAPGEFSDKQSERFTRRYAFHRLKFSFKNLFDIGAGESVVYHGRGIELGYLNPLVSYKFVEHSLQDRDNTTFHIDLQTHFLKGIQFQGAIFLDENIIFNLDEIGKFRNKTAYQLGTFLYAPAGVDNLSLQAEYTKIRPYVYTHKDPGNRYTVFGINTGHEIGPNADQIFTRLRYNLSEKVTFDLGYEKIRSGENILDESGNVGKNVGGDVLVPFRPELDSEDAPFLDGERFNTHITRVSIRYEFIRDFFVDFFLEHRSAKNLSKNSDAKSTFAYLKLRFDL
jgi:hypothetical protein